MGTVYEVTGSYLTGFLLLAATATAAAGLAHTSVRRHAAAAV
jgi:MFS transporter, NNP family, nitrate/nitrite transporter